MQVLDRSFRILDALAASDDAVSPADLAAGLRLHKSTIHRLPVVLARIRRRGYAVDNEEAEEGLRCIGAPVRDYTGGVVAALSIAGPVGHVKSEPRSRKAIS